MLIILKKTRPPFVFSILGDLVSEQLLAVAKHPCDGYSTAAAEHVLGIPVHYAVRHGGMACLRILLGEGCADEQVRTLSGGDRRRLPAHEAAIAGDLDALALLLQRTDLKVHAQGRGVGGGRENARELVQSRQQRKQQIDARRGPRTTAACSMTTPRATHLFRRALLQ